MGRDALGGNTGGTDIVAQIINKYTPSAGNRAVSCRWLVIAAGASFGFERALFAIITLYISGRRSTSCDEPRNEVCEDRLHRQQEA